MSMFFPTGLRLGGRLIPADLANVAYDGILSEIPIDADGSFARLLDRGRYPKDNAVLYSGQMLDFDGVDDYVGLNYDLCASSAYTFCATVTIANNTGERTFLESTESSSNRNGIGLYNNRIAFSYYDGSSYQIVASEEVAGTYRVAGVRSGSLMVLYINSVDSYGDEAGVNLGLNSSGTVIGSRAGVSNYFDGQLGNVQIWNAAWDADDVAFDYANPETPAYNRPGTSLTEANLQGWWPLIEGSGDTAYDWSGNGNHGTLTNFTLDTAWENADALSDPRVLQTALMGWGMGSNLWSNSSMAGWSATDLTLTTDYDSGLDGIGGTRVVATSNSGRWRNGIAVTAETDYIFGFFAKNNGGTEVKYGVYDNTAPDWVINATSYVAQLSSDEYTLIAVPFTTPVGCISVILYSIAEAGTTDVDVIVWPQVFMVEGSDVTASAITHANPATNALTPLRDWETAGRFTRDYNELSFSGKSYTQATTTISDTMTIEMVVDIKDVTSLQYLFDGRYSAGTGSVSQTAGTVTASSGTVYVDNSATTTIAAGKAHVVISGITLDLTRLDLMGDNAGANLLTGQMPMFKLWEGTWDAATVEKYYNKAATKYGL